MVYDLRSSTLPTLSHSDNSRVDSFLGKSTAFKAIGLARLPVCHPARQCRGPAMVPCHTAIENMVLVVADNAVTCYRQSLYNAKLNCPPSRHDDCTQGSLGLPLAKYWSG